MPIISTFYGVIILMYYFDNKQHHAPHIHVTYQDELMTAWKLAKEGQPISKIDPLR